MWSSGLTLARVSSTRKTGYPESLNTTRNRSIPRPVNLMAARESAVTFSKYSFDSFTAKLPLIGTPGVIGGSATVRVAVRDTEAALFVKVLGDTGQIVPWPADITRPDQVAAAVDGADMVVNLVGILFKTRRQGFADIHQKGAETVATEARAAGVKRLVHISAIGGEEDSPSEYGRSKAAGVKAVMAAFPGASIVRPSVIFGTDDNFFNIYFHYISHIL